MARKSQFNLPNPTTGTQEVHHFETELSQVIDIVRLANTAYSVKDIRFCGDMPPGWYLECTTAGTSGSGDITLPSPLVENATITDGTCVWKVRKISSADGVAVGIILPFAGNGNIPSGYLLCDGAAYSRTAFPDLFAAIGTDYGSGDGSTTFNVPDSNQAKRFLQGDTVAGTVKAAGLPNITGNASFNVTSTAVGVVLASGAFSATNPALNVANISGTTSSGNRGLTLDASQSSSIYGNSTTVQPNALTTRYIIKAFDGMTADSALIDITQYENELGNKADRSLSNLTDAGKAFSFPSDTWIDISSYFTLSYTAPADGFVMLQTLSQVNGLNTATIKVNNISWAFNAYTVTNLSNAMFVPVKKGDIVQGGGVQVVCDAYRFYYAQGEVPV